MDRESEPPDDESKEPLNSGVDGTDKRDAAAPRDTAEFMQQDHSLKTVRMTEEQDIMIDQGQDIQRILSKQSKSGDWTKADEPRRRHIENGKPSIAPQSLANVQQVTSEGFAVPVPRMPLHTPMDSPPYNLLREGPSPTERELGSIKVASLRLRVERLAEVANHHFNLKDFRTALVYYDAARDVPLEPSSDFAYRRALCVFYTQTPSKAEPSLRNVVEQLRDDDEQDKGRKADLSHRLAQVYLQLGNLDEADRFGEEALHMRKNGENCMPLYESAFLLWRIWQLKNEPSRAQGFLDLTSDEGMAQWKQERMESYRQLTVGMRPWCDVSSAKLPATVAPMFPSSPNGSGRSYVETRHSEDNLASVPTWGTRDSRDSGYGSSRGLPPRIFELRHGGQGDSSGQKYMDASKLDLRYTYPVLVNPFTEYPDPVHPDPKYAYATPEFSPENSHDPLHSNDRR